MNRLFATSLVPAAQLLCAALSLCACATKLQREPPPLHDMVEPLDLFQEPDDEAVRSELALGGFTGCYVGDSRDSLEAMLGESEGVEVIRIVENSPADAAGLRVGDLLLEARIEAGAPRALHYPSEWREVELACSDATTVAVVFDRANRRTQATLSAVPRIHPLERGAVERVHEEERVGVVVRTATEVEARGAGLGPGGGAVVVGLSKASPWRDAGLQFGDLIVSVDGRPVAHPQVVVDAIRAAGDGMTVEIVRDGAHRSVETPLSRRAQETREVYIPILFSHEQDRGKSDTSVLLGLFGYESTAAAWRVRLLWFIYFGGGDADRLLEVDK